MTIHQTCSYLVLVSVILSFAGCSAWGPSTKGAAQFDQGSLEGQSKSLAGVYRDVGSDGSY